MQLRKRVALQIWVIIIIFKCHLRVKNGTILDREIVQLITPGTLLDPEGAAANHLLSIVPGPEENLGLAWLELSTSNFQVRESMRLRRIENENSETLNFNFIFVGGNDQRDTIRRTH